MNLPHAPQSQHVRYRVRHQARLDAETHTKLKDLAAAFHRTRSAILRYVMQWGLAQTKVWTIDQAIPATVQTVGILLSPELLLQVQEAAAAHDASVAAWVREAMRRVSPEDFPASWRAKMTDVRTHDSPTYRRRFMLRLDETTTQKLQELVEQVGRSREEIIRQLMAQATLEAFPPSWQLAAAERQRHPSQ
jgi:predicted transcriptional regulator